MKKAVGLAGWTHEGWSKESKRLIQAMKKAVGLAGWMREGWSKESKRLIQTLKMADGLAASEELEEIFKKLLTNSET